MLNKLRLVLILTLALCLPVSASAYLFVLSSPGCVYPYIYSSLLACQAGGASLVGSPVYNCFMTGITNLPASNFTTVSGIPVICPELN